MCGWLLGRRQRVKTVWVYKDEKGEWRWRARAFNNESIAVSGEGYVHLIHAMDMAKRLFPAAKIEQI